MPTVRERASDALLHSAIDLAADREQLDRSMRSAHVDPHDYELARGTLMLAAWVDSLLLWLSVRLRPKPLTR